MLLHRKSFTSMTASTPSSLSLLLLTFLYVTVTADQVQDNNNTTMSLSVPINSVAIDLFKVLSSSSPGQNVFFSPLSVSTALSMTMAGAKGETEKQLFTGLHFNQTVDCEEKVPPLFRQYIQELSSDENKLYELLMANKLVIDQSLRSPETDNFKNVLSSNFDATIDSVNFGADGEKIKDKINTWVSEKTKRFISQLLSSAPDPLTRAIILNGIFFKGKWEHPFEPDNTRNETFNNHGSLPVQVGFMHQSGLHTPVRSENGSITLQLKYRGGMSMVIMMPSSVEQLEQLEKEITPEFVDEQVRSLRSQEIDSFRLPKFRLETSYELKDSLRQLDIVDLFEPSSADLTGISAKPGLVVSDVIHKAVIDVDEAGTRAAAVTGVIAVTMSLSLTQLNVAIDRPFIFLIRDDVSGLISFIGKVDNL